MDWLQIAERFGFPVLCVVALAVFVVRLLNGHKEERVELVREIKTAHGETLKAHETAKRDITGAFLQLVSATQDQARSTQFLAGTLDKMERTMTRIKCIERGD